MTLPLCTACNGTGCQICSGTGHARGRLPCPACNGTGDEPQPHWASCIRGPVSCQKCDGAGQAAAGVPPLTEGEVWKLARKHGAIIEDDNGTVPMFYSFSGKALTSFANAMRGSSGSGGVQEKRNV